MAVTFNTNLDDVEVKEGEQSIATDQLTDLNNVSDDDKPRGRVSPVKAVHPPEAMRTAPSKEVLPPIGQRQDDFSDQLKQMRELKEIVMQQQRMIEEMKKNEDKQQV